MTKRPNVRWMVLLSILGVTVIAILYPVEDQMVRIEAVDQASVPAARFVSAAPASVVARRPWVASDENPFAPRAWDAPAPPAVTTGLPGAAEAPAPQPVPQAPPPFPYRFLGQMQDGSVRVFYLGDGEQVLLARLGEVLEGSYKLVAVADEALEFESVQTGTRHVMQIPAQ